jgi:hypothetical protein
LHDRPLIAEVDILKGTNERLDKNIITDWRASEGGHEPAAASSSENRFLQTGNGSARAAPPAESRPVSQIIDDDIPF